MSENAKYVLFTLESKLIVICFIVWFKSTLQVINRCVPTLINVTTKTVVPDGLISCLVQYNVPLGAYGFFSVARPYQMVPSLELGIIILLS